MSENENSERKVGSKTVIPLSNDKFRYVETENKQGRSVTTRDENYMEVETHGLVGAGEEDVAARAIRNFTKKGPEVNYVKTSDNKENQNEE